MVEIQNIVENKFLPLNKDHKLYSPIGVRNLFQNAVDSESGNIQAIFDNPNKYRTLIELWYATVLSVAIYRWRGEKFWMYPSDSPDVHFIRKDGQNGQEGFSVEIMTLYNYRQTAFDGDYQQMAKMVFRKKGEIDYDRTELLLVSRLTGNINIDKFADEINKFKWNFLRIWLSIFSEKDSIWTIFEISPYGKENPIGKISVAISDLPF